MAISKVELLDETGVTPGSYTAANLTIGADGRVTAASSGTTGGTVPVGGIIIWSGSVASVPAGWALCNGGSGTPDLRSRFVVCAGGSYSVGLVGGSADAVVVAHSHSITDPGHLHSINTNDSSDGGGDQSPEIGTGADRFTNLATTGISIDSAGVSGVNQNLPPYYALAYIMRIS